MDSRKASPAADASTQSLTDIDLSIISEYFADALELVAPSVLG